MGNLANIGLQLYKIRLSPTTTCHNVSHKHSTANHTVHLHTDLSMLILQLFLAGLGIAFSVIALELVTGLFRYVFDEVFESTTTVISDWFLG